MYHLTCPTCESLTESAFVRSGAVVRCPVCQQKYRIKSSHFERVIHTGPRTIDETDAVLRSDSVDIEPDEVAPVSIDDEGNVVGLSGLSELMRWSDGQAESNGKAGSAKTKAGDQRTRKLQDRVEREALAEQGALPAAVVPGGPSTAEPSARSSHRDRARRSARKRKQQIWMIFGGVLFVVLVATVALFTSGVFERLGNQPVAGQNDGEDAESQAPATATQDGLDTPGLDSKPDTPAPETDGGQTSVDDTSSGGTLFNVADTSPPRPAVSWTYADQGAHTDPVLNLRIDNSRDATHRRQRTVDSSGFACDA